MTLDALGVLVGADKSTVSRWETGRVPIPSNRLRRVSDVTGIPVEHLLRAAVPSAAAPAAGESPGSPAAPCAEDAA